MQPLDLATIRAMNAKRPGGYWRRVIAELCDEAERLRKEPEQLPDPDSICRLCDSGDPIPPWIVRALCERVERAGRQADQNAAYLRRLQDEYARLGNEYADAHARAEWAESVMDAARAWDDATGDGKEAAEQALRETLKGLQS